MRTSLRRFWPVIVLAGAILAGAAAPVIAEDVGLIVSVCTSLLKQKGVLDATGVYSGVSSTALDALLGSTRGSTAIRGASGWTVLPPGTSTYVLTSNGAGADPSYQAAARGSAPTIFYGDGSDGSVTFDGSTTVLTLVPSGNVYTLARDIFLTSGTVNSGVSIITNGYRIFATGTLTINGTLKCDGGAASGATAGTGFAVNGNLQLPTTTPSSGVTTASTGTNGQGATTNTLSGGGGGGGNSNGTTNSNGTAGTGIPSALSWAHSGAAVFQSAMGTSSSTSAGGRGSGDGTNAGGGPGVAGGAMVVAAKTIACGASVSIHANGGNGGNGAGGTAGGGGGGGGGVVILYADSYTGTALVSGTNVTANGGTHGNGSTTAGNGADGTVGFVGIYTRQ